MTEKEKMLARELYNANYDENLIKKRLEAQDLCKEYNDLKPSEIEKRVEMINKIFGKVGNMPIVEQNFWCNYGYNISVGDNFYMNHNCIILDGAKVEFGDNVTIGAGSIVTKDVPSNVVAYGNPCEVIRSI